MKLIDPELEDFREAGGPSRDRGGIIHDLIVSPFLGDFLILRPGDARGVRISEEKYEELRDAPAAPAWLAAVSRKTWNADPGVVLLRPSSALGYGKASYELNLGCNYDCEHCYLGLKKFDGLEWAARERLLEIIRDAGVLWLQLTGGEPMIDRLFGAVYTRAYELGFMIEILTNGSRLADRKILDLLAAHRPSRVIVSVYGASQETYDGLTRRKGSFKGFMRALNAARSAGIRLELSLIITERNAHEKEQMTDLAQSFGRISGEYGNISPTIYGGAESLPSQSPEFLTARKPFTGCEAGHTAFHVNPYGQASICKIGREPSVDLLTEGSNGLARLGQIADGLLRRQGGCAGCTLQSTCGTCMPLVQLYRKSGAPLALYCQHKEPRKEVTR
jgi:MoaA/NifB/PqqE/SkfB family radical SAM enzyme